MAKNNNLTDFLTAVAGAIRTKKGTTELINPQNFESEIASISGGGEQPTGNYSVKVIDYDGTVLLETKGNTGDVITLPTAPTHDKLVFQEWSASVAVTNNTITIEDNDVIVGAVYTTASGKSEFDITLTKVTGLSVTLNMDGIKDWGDGTSDTTITHTYTTHGDYTIKCDGTTMTTSESSGLFAQTSSAKNYYCIEARLANVTSIGSYAFRFCPSLTSITISNSVTSIGAYAFHYCPSLTSITIPNGVTSIGESAFYYCSSLTSITIPSSVISIGSQTFYYCYSLTNIIIPNSVTRISNSMFYYCYSLTDVTIPNSVTSIEIGAFYNCYSLTDIIIPGSVTSIGNGAFASCYSLTNITIPNSVTSIGNKAFQNCYALTNITIPSSVTSISSSAFSNCSSLTNITIPNSVTSIGSSAFESCYSIIRYDFSQHASIPTLSNTNAFNNINGICKIIVPDNLYDSWKAATNWSTYADYIYKASEVNSGGSGGGETQTITFTIAGTSYQAEEGMTWGDWVNSSYNTNGYKVSRTQITTADSSRYVSTVNSEVIGVTTTTTIIANKTYYEVSSGGGGGN